MKAPSKVSSCFYIAMLLTCSSAGQTSEELAERGKRGDVSAILELGKRDDPEARRLLSSIPLTSLHYEPAAEALRQALARQGDKASFLSIASDALFGPPTAGMRELEYVRDRRSFYLLYILLEDRIQPPMSSDLSHFSPSETAMIYLSRMVEHPPVEELASVDWPTRRSIWDAWFRQHSEFTQNHENWKQELEAALREGSIRTILTIGVLSKDRKLMMEAVQRGQRGADSLLALHTVLAGLGEPSSRDTILREISFRPTDQQTVVLKCLYYLRSRPSLETLCGIIAATGHRQSSDKASAVGQEPDLASLKAQAAKYLAGVVSGLGLKGATGDRPEDWAKWCSQQGPPR